MTKELLDMANELSAEINEAKDRLDMATYGGVRVEVRKKQISQYVHSELGDARMAHIRHEVISGLQEQYDKLQAEFDALGNGSERGEQDG